MKLPDADRHRRSYETYLRLVENSPFGVYLINFEFKLIQVSAGAQKVFEKVRPLLGRDFHEVLRQVWPAPFAEEAIAHFHHTLDTGQAYRSVDTTWPRRDIDAVETYDWQIERVVLPDESHGVVCYFYDLTERRLHEERIRLLAEEFNHRTKNILSVVQAISQQTAFHSPRDFVRRFNERLRALAANHDLLIKNDWRGATMTEMVRAQLIPFGDLLGTRISIEGPHLALTTPVAEALGLAIHELATNAAKYGALSDHTGRVDIRWAIDDQLFALEWVETSGPEIIAPPNNMGFGSMILAKMTPTLVRGKGELDYKRTGLRWSLRCALDSFKKL